MSFGKKMMNMMTGGFDMKSMVGMIPPDKVREEMIVKFPTALEFIKHEIVPVPELEEGEDDYALVFISSPTTCQIVVLCYNENFTIQRYAATYDYKALVESVEDQEIVKLLESMV